ncbi:hypothetical protein J1N35_021507 [Gossypium stocksii]|uniref:Uncharacterized protein n=1 Tax=Gossypium stocksii TaxID=47602 RepID=A0A9D3VEM6_9ROSI|nr:hypothetical protein J1N35_021507 [Gossypium stocksii]
MSFLAGRLAGKEGAFFFQESKQAVNRLVEKTPKNLPSNPPSLEQQTQADVLPEVLKHSLPSKIFRQPSDASSLSRSSKWALHTHPTNASSSSPDALNPLRAYVSLPQVTFGPKRWELPTTEHSTMASTANELRKDKYTPLNPEKLKAAAEGLKRIGMAFIVATTMVFGGAALMFGIAASKLDLHSVSITYYTHIDNFLSSLFFWHKSVMKYIVNFCLYGSKLLDIYGCRVFYHHFSSFSLIAVLVIFIQICHSPPDGFLGTWSYQC